MTMRRHTRLPRLLHPIAWWIWALSIAVAVSRTTNPLLLLIALAVLGLVVANRRIDAPWARAFKYYLGLALVVIAIHVVLRAVFASAVAPSDHVIVRLPRLPLPHWYSGVQIGGAVTSEAVAAAAVDGLRLATLICCIGAANALANPKRALRVLPGALHELGVAVTVAITVAPQLVESAQRIARAQRLRARDGRGRRVLRRIAIPVMEDALARSLELAAAMDARGYGRARQQSSRTRWLTSACVLGGLLGLCAGVYGLLDESVPRAVGLPAMAIGAVLCALGLGMGGRRVIRTKYRPDPWRAPEWIVVACGIATAGLFFVAAHLNPAAVNPSFAPLHAPPLPWLPTVALLIGAIPSVAAPPVPTAAAPRRAVVSLVDDADDADGRLGAKTDTSAIATTNASVPV
jgi:energy-coupling factor transport system permease protein